MKLIVGLGNPGREYKNTRHNIGFIVLDNYLGKISWKVKQETHFYSTIIDNEEIIFIKPLTYMNLSGLAVKKIVKYYKVEMSDILVVHDDLDLPVGSYRIKRNSSSGGHNGIKSIISELGNQEFGRLKIGIGKSSQISTDKYVLGKFSTEEENIINENMDSYISIIDTFIKNGIEKTMEKHNN